MLDRDLVLPNLLVKQSAERPEDLFIQDVAGPTSTNSEMVAAMQRWAGALRNTGVEPGQTVATMIPTSVPAYEVWLGTAWLRAIEAPVNSMFRGPMLSYTVNDTRAELLIIHARYLEQLEQVSSEIEHLERVVVVGQAESTPSLPWETVSADSFLADAKPADDLPGPEHYDIACMIYTSGTTGPSKGVLMPWSQLYEFPAMTPLDGLQAGTGYYHFLPIFHVSGKIGPYLAATRDATCVIREMFSPMEFWTDIKKFNCTSVGLIGPLSQIMLQLPEVPEEKDNPLVGITMGPLIKDHEAFAERFGVRISTGYGMTEVGVPFGTEGYNIEDWQSVGKIRDGYQAQVVNEHDEPLGAGEVGELVVRHDGFWKLNAGYWHRPESTAKAWRNGWFHTGDAFRRDENGNWFFVDRMKDAIRRRGENISSFEVESYINAHEDVQESAAIAVPSELGEDEVKVVAVLQEGAELTPESLIEYLIPIMPRFMIPRYVEFVDAFPKTPTMRTRKVELRKDPLNDNTWDREEAGIELPRQ